MHTSCSQLHSRTHLLPCNRWLAKRPWRCRSWPRASSASPSSPLRTAWQPWTPPPAPNWWRRATLFLGLGCCSCRSLMRCNAWEVTAAAWRRRRHATHGTRRGVEASSYGGRSPRCCCLALVARWLVRCNPVATGGGEHLPAFPGLRSRRTRRPRRPGCSCQHYAAVPLRCGAAAASRRAHAPSGVLMRLRDPTASPPGRGLGPALLPRSPRPSGDPPRCEAPAGS